MTPFKDSCIELKIMIQHSKL